MATAVWRRSRNNGFAKFPVYSSGKEAQLHLLRSAMSGKMPAYNADGTIRRILHRKTEKGELRNAGVRRFKNSIHDNFEDFALEVRAYQLKKPR
jgi:hypothetical protein